VKDAVCALLRAWFWGSVTGGALFLLLTVPLAIMSIGQTSVATTLLVALMPILVAGAVTGPAIVLLGLPLTVLLAHLGRESPGLYLAAGFGLGLALPIGIVFSMGGDGSGAWLSIFGAVAGTVAAGIWGSWRQRVAEGRSEPAEHPDGGA
jgi:hypothetical protein